ncbi:MAG: hypothetical protein K2Q20_04800 [Phycisphaerales bacterium]|nr:hypothetical protein [Phycisphaerales bacterium]
MAKRLAIKLAALERASAARLDALSRPSAREWTDLFAARDPGNAALLAECRAVALECAPLLGEDGPHWNAGHAALALVYASGMRYEDDPPTLPADPTPDQARAATLLGELVVRAAAFARETGLTRSIPMLDLEAAMAATETSHAP